MSYPAPHQSWNIYHPDGSPLPELSDEKALVAAIDAGVLGVCSCGFAVAAGEIGRVSADMHRHREDAKALHKARATKTRRVKAALLRDEQHQTPGQALLFDFELGA